MHENFRFREMIARNENMIPSRKARKVKSGNKNQEIDLTSQNLMIYASTTTLIHHGYKFLRAYLRVAYLVQERPWHD